MKNSEEIIVSIRCCTYNQEPYIRQCLEGFVMQKTGFRFEAVVHDDASTDNTAAIIREYADKYPDIIKPLFSKENLYSRRDGSLSRLMNEHMRGKYIAFCEGDDYWTDPFKLQKQVDFLESHPEYSACCTNSQRYFQDEWGLKNGVDRSGIIMTKDLMDRNKVVTLTSMMRADLFLKYHREISPVMPHFKMGDLPLWLFLSLHGNIYRLQDYTGVYRILEKSASHHKDFIKQYDFMLEGARIRLWFNRHYKLHYKPLILIKVLNRTRQMCRRDAKNGQESFWSLFTQAIKHLHKSGLKR